MPFKDEEMPDKIQSFLSTWTINSMLNTMTEVMEWKFWLRANLTRDKITCSMVEVLLPGISEAYGPDRPLDIFV